MTEKDITIKGKTTSQYLASVVVGSLPPRPFNIRMRQDDAGQHHRPAAERKRFWSSYTKSSM
ncbi:hypothetical protein ACLK17_11245 [Escherichia coli]